MQKHCVFTLYNVKMVQFPLRDYKNSNFTGPEYLAPNSRFQGCLAPFDSFLGPYFKSPTKMRFTEYLMIYPRIQAPLARYSIKIQLQNGWSGILLPIFPVIPSNRPVVEAFSFRIPPSCSKLNPFWGLVFENCSTPEINYSNM